MRRRIDRELNDSTDKPYLSLDEIEGKLYLQPADPALYDDALWAECVDARERLRAIELQITAALVNEPLDDVEIELGRKQWRMTSDVEPYDSEEWQRVEDALRKHAARQERKP